MTIVAFETSASELAVSILPAFQDSNEIAISNVVGSNIFNMFFLGVSSLIRPVDVNVAFLYDMIILIAISIIAVGFSYTKRTIDRTEGIVLLLIYVSDVAFAILR